MSFMEWLGPQRSSDLVEAYMTYVESCVSPIDRARVVTHDATVPDWSKTHKAVNNAASRTASFREVGDMDGGEDGSDGDEDSGHGDEDTDDSDDGSDDDGDVREPTRLGKGGPRKTASPVNIAGPDASALVPTTDSPSTAAAAASRNLEMAKRRPRPRPDWTTGRQDDDEDFPMEMKAAALKTLRQKRARRRASVESDEESENEDSRGLKRQRVGLEDITNLTLPAEPGMDTGRFFTASHGPTPAIPCPNDSPNRDITSARDSSPAHSASPDVVPIHGFSPARTASPGIAPIHGSSSARDFSPIRDFTPLRDSTPLRDFSPTNNASPGHELSTDFEPTPADLVAREVPPLEIMVERLSSAEAVGVEWLVEPLKEFLAADGATDMLGVVDRLWRLEHQYVCEGMQAKKRATLPRGKNGDGSERLKMLGDWVAGGRTRRGRMTIDKAVLQKFTREWSGWWGSLQPDWRKRNRGAYVRSSVEGIFDTMAVPGANGMLSVVATLSWWRSAAVTGKAREQWMAASTDVEWVMDQLIKAAQSNS